MEEAIRLIVGAIVASAIYGAIILFGLTFFGIEWSLSHFAGASIIASCVVPTK